MRIVVPEAPSPTMDPNWFMNAELVVRETGDCAFVVVRDALGTSGEKDGAWLGMRIRNARAHVWVLPAESKAT